MKKLTVFLSLLFATLGTQAFQDDPITLLSKITGNEPIRQDLTLTERYSREAREQTAIYLERALAAFSDASRLESYSETGTNVVGEIRATKKTNQWLVLGAHYDSVKDCPGANDNATGVALVYAVAKHLSTLQKRNYNIYIVFFDEEERGLIGSKAFARQLKEAEIEVNSVHTIDQMGWDEDGDKGIELELPTDALKAFYLKVAEEYGFDFPIHTTNVKSTDHQAFRELGFDAIGITEEYKNDDSTPHYHRATDTFDTVNLDYLKSTTLYMQQVFESLMRE